MLLFYFGTALLLLQSLDVSGFGTMHPRHVSWTKAGLLDSNNKLNRKSLSSPSIALYLAGAQVSTPSPEEAAEMGARDWPQQIKKGTWVEEITQGDVKTRYVLEGAGTLVASTDNDGGASTSRVGPGTLVEATGPVKLEWEVKGKAVNNEMIILTPGYEQQGLLLAVAGLFLVLCGSLVVFS